MPIIIHKKTADIQFSSGGVVRETARAAERVAIVYRQECPPWNADLQGSRNQCTNNKVNKSYEHGSAPSFVFKLMPRSSCETTRQKTVGMWLGASTLRTTRGMQINKAVPYLSLWLPSWVDRMSHRREQCWIAAGFVLMQTEILNKWAENPTCNSYK